MKILVIGKARHGKDTACEILRDKFGLSFASSSDFVAERAVYPTLFPKYGYKSAAEAYADRVNHREEWRDLISAYNAEDPARLAKELLEHHDVYCGMRSLREFKAVRELFDCIMWVDASERVGGVDPSLDIPCGVTQHWIDNNGSLERMTRQIETTLNLICADMALDNAIIEYDKARYEHL